MRKVNLEFEKSRKDDLHPMRYLPDSVIFSTKMFGKKGCTKSVFSVGFKPNLNPFCLLTIADLLRKIF